MDKYSADYALSATDILKITGRYFDTYKFAELKRFDDIMKLFNMENGVGSCLILYRQDDHFGHWCAMNCIDKGNDKYVINYFDSYGRFIDDSSNYIPEKTRIRLLETKPFIRSLIARSNMKNIKFHYNDKRLQGPKTSTCGRYCAVFMKYPFIKVEEFVKMLKSTNINQDKQIVFMTNIFMAPTDKQLRKKGTKYRPINLNSLG